ncbi:MULTISPECIES: hypothetical protein [Nocardiopsidaceae]|jgi:hypothetical protein|uniref:Uncharacterized protein n=2 Tax=Nocardiopsidaceae TaxID=83676 RepID=A0ABY6YQY0_9ACTN|nr:hypothetical protein [Streptomonospora nanhaiensis]WAE74734.1 hypothetical protein OUQ99_06400 [Streptomonospora nanhaiensis]
MFDDLIGWFKGLFGGAAEEVTQGVTDTLEGAGVGTAVESAQGFGEEAYGGAVESAQAFGEETYGGAVESAQAFGEEAYGGVAEEAQAYGQEALGGVTETVEGVQGQADAIGGVIEDPGAAAADAARDQFYGNNG